MTGAELAVVVSTIGRRDEFRRLVESVDRSPVAEQVEFVVVDQSDDGRCAEVLDRGTWRMTVRSARSARGASIGRNTGLRLTAAAVVAFPDDDAWYPDETLPRLLERFRTAPDLAALCGRQITSDGRPSMLRWLEHETDVTARNFLQTSIMSTMFFRRSWLDEVSGADGVDAPFDETMGVGAPGWYGACEESDLLLRVVEAGGRVRYDPNLYVFQQEPRDAVDVAFVDKMLRYGCGQGHLWRKRKLAKTQLAYFCARKLAAATVRSLRGDRMLARSDLAWLRGNIAGLRDVPPAGLRPTPTAVVPRRAARP